MRTIARAVAFLLLCAVLTAGCEKPSAPVPKEPAAKPAPPKEVEPIPPDKKIPAK
jgi:hypothetical protein